ncbi:MAG TPA: hypothetical protein PKV98_04345 [Burkholderiaceae bacterium]|nr:hypothetical protein [Burkholderiaceae bacterium]
MSGKTYYEKLKDPRWQKRRLDILARDEWMCQACYDAESTLHVHHIAYRKGAEPWEYPDHMLVTLCEECHEDFGNLAYEIVSSAAYSAREDARGPLMEQLQVMSVELPKSVVGGSVWDAIFNPATVPL